MRSKLNADITSCTSITFGQQKKVKQDRKEIMYEGTRTTRYSIGSQIHVIMYVYGMYCFIT